MGGAEGIAGRVAELAEAAGCYVRAAAGDAQVLLVTGAAGIGKTRLVREVCARTGRSTLVLVGESAPLAGAALPYGPFVAALEAHADWLVSGVAGAADGDMLAGRHRLFIRTLGVLGELAASAPLVLVLEDLHWADESSRELLSFLSVRLREQPVLMIGTLREEDIDDTARRWLAELERRPRVTRLRLAGLADAEIAEVVADLLPGPADARRMAAVIEGAEGNPLYARELARTDGTGPPASLAAVTLARAGSLSPTAQAVLKLICVADGGLDHGLLAAVTGLPEGRLPSYVREVITAGLLAAAGDGYAFPHSLIRQALYAELLPGERRRLHRELAEKLALMPDAEPGPLAQHWDRAGCPGLAAPAAVAAARQALAARAYPEATRNYRLAIDLRRWLPDPVAPVLEAAAQAASWAKDPVLAATWVSAALDETAPGGGPAAADRGRLLERLGRYRWEAGDARGAVRATAQAVTELEASPPSVVKARALATLATRLVFVGDYDRARPHAERAVALAVRTGAAAERARGLTALGLIRAQHGELDSGLAALAEASALARQVGSVEDIVHAASNRMYLLCTLGRFTEALDVAYEGRRAAQALDAPPGQLSIFGNNTAAVLVATGRWAQAGW